MPDISKINALAIGSVSKVDGLAKASILDINGITVTDPGINPDAATSGFLFTYSGASVAFSVRQLNNNADYVMRVRRVTGTGNTGNDDEADVKFDTTLTDPTISLDSPVDNFSAGGSNATTLGEFLNVGTVGGKTYSDADSLSPNTAEAYATTWYDLTGNQNHAEQTTPAIQPQIHNGTVNTDLLTENGKPAVKFFYASGNRDSLSMTSQESIEFFTHSMVYNQSNAARFNFMNSAAIGNYYRLEANGVMFLVKSGDFDAATGSIGFSGYALRILIRDTSSTATAYVDGSSSNAWTDLDSSNFVFQNIDGTYNLESASQFVNHQEFVIWSEAKNNTDRTGIETNINGFFGIY